MIAFLLTNPSRWGWLSLLLSGTAHALIIEAFGLSSQPFVATAGAAVCYVDRAARQQQALTTQLAEQSQVPDQQWVQHHQAALRQLADSERCRLLAKQLGIRRLPAIVFNRQQVMYGERNVVRAQRWWAAIGRQR